MLKKKYLKSRDVSKVTFELSSKEIPADVEVNSVNLLGDFNGWNPDVTPMKYLKRGAYQATLELEPNRKFQFRYLINGEHWWNDWEADGYTPGKFGDHNSVVSTAQGNGLSG